MSKSLAEYLSEVRRAIPVGDKPSVNTLDETAPITDKVDLAAYRPLRQEEEALIHAMLERNGVKGQGFIPQLEGMLATSDCSCGCPSLSFAPPDEDKRLGLYRHTTFAEMYGYSADGSGLVGLILGQAGGKLCGLEVYDLAGRPDGLVWSLPPVAELLTAEELMNASSSQS